MTRAAYQGIPGAYGESAALQLEYEPVSCTTFADTAMAVEDERADVALLPVENSTEGGVGGSNDVLLDTGLHITGETYLHVVHCLIGTGGIKDVRTVYSHQQALGQCGRFIGDRGWRTVPTLDTAEAVIMVRDMRRPDAAAIASNEAASAYQMPVIATGINDVRENYTRFLVLGREPVARTGGHAGEYKTTVVFTLKHEPGALHAALGPLRGTSMTRIESRPVKNGRFEYCFVADFMGHGDDDSTRRALAGLERSAESLRILGSYPAASAPRLGC